MTKRIVFDFDGVIHSYVSGWKGEDVIPDKPVKDIDVALKALKDEGYEIIVATTRCQTDKGRRAVIKWLKENGIWQYIYTVTLEKPPAIAYVDDRAIKFDGNPFNLLYEIRNFKTWQGKK